MSTGLSAKEIRKGYEIFIGKGDKLQYYTKKFDAMRAKNSKISFNLCALLFGSFWCFYRQMLALGAVALLLNFAANYLSIVYGLTAVSSIAQLVLAGFFGFFGNYCYMRHVEHAIEEASTLEGAAKEKYYKENGGTNVKILLGMLCVAVVLTFALLASTGGNVVPPTT